MIVQHFSTGTRFMWTNGLFEVKRLLPDWMLNIEELSTGAVQIVNRQQLLDAWHAGKLRFFVESMSKPAPDARPVIELSDYPDHVVAKARVRFWVIEPLLQLTPSERTKAVIDQRIREALAEAKGDPVKLSFLPSLSRRTVFRWIRVYTKSGGDIRVFIDAFSRCGGKRQSRLPAVLSNIVDGVIKDLYLKRETETIDDVYHELSVRLEDENHVRSRNDQLKLPARSTVARRIEALDMQAKFTVKRGKQAAKHEFEQVGQLVRPKKPLDRTEIDDTWSDAIVLDETDGLPLGRPVFTHCLDVATAYPLGYYLGFEPPSYYSIMECLYHAICPKPDTRDLYDTEHNWITQGIPKALVIDNGRHYIGKDLEDACLALGITLVYSPVRTPQFKPHVERTFGTYNWLFHRTPGTTFSNIIQRGDYDSVRKAVVTLPELIKSLNIYTVDVYAEKWHSGLDGIPARRWEEAMKTGYPLRLPASKDELRILLGRVDYRTIQRYGIDYLHIRYNAPELSRLRQQLKGEKVKIKYHPADLSRIYVCDPGEEVYLEIPALNQEYTQGLSLWKHRIIRDFAVQEEEQVNMIALGRAKRKIREIFDRARSRKHNKRDLRKMRWGEQPPSLADKPAPQTNTTPVPAPSSPFLLPLGTDSALQRPNTQPDGWSVGYVRK